MHFCPPATFQTQKLMKLYEVEIVTEHDETVVLEVMANSPRDAEQEAMRMVEDGEVETDGRQAIVASVI